MTTGITVSSIVSEYGSYYENAGQNKARVLRELFQGLITPQYMTQIKTDDTIYKMAKATIGTLVQAFQKGFTPKGGHTFTARPIEMFHLKADDSFYPDDIVGTWLGFLEGMEIPERKAWPIVRYLIEEAYLPQMAQDIELYEIFSGNHVTPAEGVAGTTGESMDGIRKLLLAGLTDGTMNHISLPTPTQDNIFDCVELFVDGISEVYQGVPMNLFMSNTLKKWYLRDKRAQGFYQKTGDNQIDSGIDFTPNSVVGLPSMGSSKIFFATPKSNFIYVTKRTTGMNNFEIQGIERIVKVLTDFWIGVGFGINEVVWVANANGSGSGSGE